MNNFRLFLTFWIALFVALGVSYVVYRQLIKAPEAMAGTTSVYVAARDLPIGVLLEEADLKPILWNADEIPAGAAMDPSLVIGRSLVFPVFAGEPVLEKKLAAVGSGAGLSAVIGEGMRAVSIRVDEVVAVAGFVVAGTHVDVLWTGDPTTAGSGDRLTRTVLENAQVLAAGQQIQPDAEGRPEQVNVVTLLCTPEDAARVILAAGEGRIQLLLRNAVDQTDESVNAPVIRRGQLFGAAPPPPAKAAPRRAPRPAPRPVQAVEEPVAPDQIMVIRGSTVSHVEITDPS